MATTSASRLLKALEAFFRERLQPAGAQLKAAGPLFPLRSDPAAASYYVTRSRTRMERADFERLGSLSPETLAGDLSRLWRELGIPDLVSLAPELAELAHSAREVEREQEGDVSAFVYAMY